MNEDKKVALKTVNLPVPEKINKARLAVKSIGANPTVFTNPNPTLAVVTAAINDLEAAWNAAADGSKIKVALMHDKEKALDKLLKYLGYYVEQVANGNEEIIHLSSFDVKKVGVRHKPDFEVYLPDDRGIVGLRCKARRKTVYRWEYARFTGSTPVFSVSHSTDVSSTFIGDLESNQVYCFRVVLIDKSGEHALEMKSITVL